MTKAELVGRLAQELEMSNAQANRVLDKLTEVITAAVKAGEEVTLPGLGKLVTKQRPERQGINPSTKEKVTIPACRVPAFKVAKQLKDAVK